MIPGMAIEHAGSAVSFRINVNEKNNGFKIVLEDGTEKNVLFEGGATIMLMCPSIDGTVIWCMLSTEEEIFCDSLTGIFLSQEDLKKRMGEILFYS